MQYEDTNKWELLTAQDNVYIMSEIISAFLRCDDIVNRLSKNYHQNLCAFKARLELSLALEGAHEDMATLQVGGRQMEVARASMVALVHKNVKGDEAARAQHQALLQESVTRFLSLLEEELPKQAKEAISDLAQLHQEILAQDELDRAYEAVDMLGSAADPLPLKSLVEELGIALSTKAYPSQKARFLNAMTILAQL